MPQEFVLIVVINRCPLISKADSMPLNPILNLLFLKERKIQMRKKMKIVTNFGTTVPLTMLVLMRGPG